MIEELQSDEVVQTVENTPWFGIRVKPRSEFRVSGELSLREFEAFLPAHQVKRRWTDRLKVSEEPLFPGYLFCRFDLSERVRILEVPGVIQVVGIGKDPVPISGAEIAIIQTMVASRIALTPWPYLEAGQKVLINTGPLAGVRGVVIKSETGNPRVVVSVTLLQRSIAAEIDRDWIGLVGESQPPLAQKFPI